MVECSASTPIHRSAYVPYPPHEPLGRVEMHLSILSRYGLASAWRHPLPLLREPWIRRQFNLRRAALEARLPLQGGGELAVLNTHLSAFGYGDGTVERQVAVLTARLGQLDDEATPWVLAGDLNALPPGDEANRLGSEADQYPEPVTPVAPLFARWTSAVPEAALARGEGRTYVPWGSSRADRTLDYAFLNRVRCRRWEVVADGAQWSDHLPLVVELDLG